MKMVLFYFIIVHSNLHLYQKKKKEKEKKNMADFFYSGLAGMVSLLCSTKFNASLNLLFKQDNVKRSFLFLGLRPGWMRSYGMSRNL